VAPPWVITPPLTWPLGSDPATMFPGGPSDQRAGLVRLDPWRLSLYQAADMAAGRRPTVWQPTGVDAADEVAVS